MKIPFLDLQTNYKNIKDEVNEEIQKVLDTSSYINGPIVKKFENNFAKYIGKKHCIGVNSGTSALEIAIKCLELNDGDEIITQSNTFIATCLAITNNNLKLVLVDANPNTYMINAQEIEKKITKKTKAIIPVHMYGHCADIDEILNIAKKYNLYVIEDTAQAAGAKYNNKMAGSFGILSCFSFYPGKNLGAYGDGGAILTDNDKLANKCRMIKNLGSKQKYYHEIPGTNSRLDSIQAAVLNIKLKYLDEWNSNRNMIAKKYIEELSKIKQIQLIQKNSKCYHIYHLFVILVDDRDELKNYLEKRGISTGIHYPVPFHKSDVYINMFKNEKYKVVEDYARRALSLPIYPELKDNQINYIILNIRNFYNY